jgi:hypothetical protein
VAETQRAGREEAAPLDVEIGNESTGFSEKDVQKLQDRAAQGRAVCHLQREKAQAETGLIGAWPG